MRYYGKFRCPTIGNWDDKLNDGVKTAVTGTKTLNDGLSAGVKQLQPIHLGSKTIHHFVAQLPQSKLIAK